VIRTQEVYIKDSSACPACGSDLITWDGPYPEDANTIVRDATCWACTLEWLEVYTLTEYVLPDGELQEEAING